MTAPENSSTTPDRERSAISSVSIELPDWPGMDDRLEVRLLCAGVDEPDGLAGTWIFGGAAPGPASVLIDWLEEGDGAVTLTPGSGRAAPRLVEGSRSDGSVIRPEMVLRLACGDSVMDFPVKVTCTDALESYYQAESHQDEYVVQHPFFLSFHKARLRVLGEVFDRTIRPGSRVLDVGSGYSIFFLLMRDWEFDITCCDLDTAAIEKMRDLCPKFTWLVSDATHLPFDDASFDTVYAGEIIEHVGDPMEALAEWRRVLAPGGTLIVTTPNRERLLARANRKTIPVHPEHMREFSLPQARAMLLASGFEVIEATGIYLELMLNWYRPAGSRVDMLISLKNKPEDERLYGPLMWAGRLFPSRAFDLVLVCRKQ
ncbi:MAG: class I SAM-dependent methyltransferase [Candidatus Geothermincolia bacterium]